AASISGRPSWAAPYALAGPSPNQVRTAVPLARPADPQRPHRPGSADRRRIAGTRWAAISKRTFMRGFNDGKLSDRLGAAEAARKAKIERFRNRAASEDPELAKRRAERQAVVAAREARQRDKEARRREEEARQAEIRRQAEETAKAEAAAREAAAEAERLAR